MRKPLILVCSLLIICNTSSSRRQYFKFVNQSEDVLDKPANYATLRSGLDKKLTSNKFTIWGSIFVEFFRTYSTFFVVKKSSDKSFWFTVYLQAMSLSPESYKPFFHYPSGGLFSTTNSTLPLRPHAWSHACVAVNADTGQVMVVINGVVTHDVRVESEGFIVSEIFTFEKNIILGLYHYQLSDKTSTVHQSEAAVSNVNIFSSILSAQDMVRLTTSEICTDGDFLSWTEASWILTGNVQKFETQELCKISNAAEYLLFPNSFYNCLDCIKLCPRMQANGRVPLIQNSTDFENMKKIYERTVPSFENTPVQYIWSSYTHDDNENFSDFYTKAFFPSPSLWTTGQPNGGKAQPCSGWWRGKTLAAGLWDTQATSRFAGQCFCQFTKSPILKLRGLCKGSHIDTHYTPIYQGGKVLYKGLTNTEITYIETEDDTKWMMTVNRKKTIGQTFADDISYVLGTHSWHITNDTAKCRYKRMELKMTGCSEGEFTCSNGDCVHMEERCDQVLDCEHKSDELNCKTVLLEESYRKTAPPLGLRRENRTRKVIPAEVKVSVTLLDISAIRETDNEIDIKFTPQFEWVESRATFYNLKTKTSQNTLEKTEIDWLWIPKIIYRNNKDNFDTRLALDNSELKVKRQGSFFRSPLEVANEIEMFQGKQNPIIMIPAYTMVLSANSI